MKIISDWFRRFFDDPQAVILTVVLVLGTSVVLVMGRDLAPVLASIVIAYLLEGVVQFLHRWMRLPRSLAVVVVFLLFLAFVLFVLLGLLPMASRQLTQLVQQLPSMIVKGQNLLLSLPALYPEFINEPQVLGVLDAIKSEMANWGQNVLSWSLAAGMGVITITIYLVLVPLLFSEVVDLHPIAIISAVLVFGGLGGFWGVFFAIPLATVVQSILKAWPRPVQVVIE